MIKSMFSLDMLTKYSSLVLGATFILLLFPWSAQAYTLGDDTPYGYGAGTTGGGSGTPYSVTAYDQFITRIAAIKADPSLSRVIRIDSDIVCTRGTRTKTDMSDNKPYTFSTAALINLPSNFTLYSEGGYMLHHCGLMIDKSTNVIVRNIGIGESFVSQIAFPYPDTFTYTLQTNANGAGTAGTVVTFKKSDDINTQLKAAKWIDTDSANRSMSGFLIYQALVGDLYGTDGILIQDSTQVWIDHCKIWKTEDGGIDVINSPSVTISNNEFKYIDKVLSIFSKSTSTPSRVSLYNNYFHYSNQRIPKVADSSIVDSFNNVYDNVAQEISLAAVTNKNIYEISNWQRGGYAVNAAVGSDTGTGGIIYATQNGFGPGVPTSERYISNPGGSIMFVSNYHKTGPSTMEAIEDYIKVNSGVTINLYPGMVISSMSDIATYNEIINRAGAWNGALAY